MIKSYEIVHPTGTISQVKGVAVVFNQHTGQAVIYSSTNIILNKISAVVPANCLIYEVIKSKL